jgi:hypothetical protein
VKKGSTGYAESKRLLKKNYTDEYMFAAKAVLSRLLSVWREVLSMVEQEMPTSVFSLSLQESPVHGRTRDTHFGG